ncbi:GSCFA domain-containing protein [Mesonia sp. K7]|uniref:GSCFA domain-containing protein n=1 Tax=Mesonia sp. K7 TaxID=2218606 RepID=UPI001F42AAAB|nr:GSCFA domain-containing protein [Mesonia sp. K7]
MDSKILLLGSCFSENIGAKFDYFKFQTLQNPFGILFHPYGIEKFIDFVVENKTFDEESLLRHNEVWLSLDAHSKHNGVDKEVVFKNLQTQLELTQNFLKESTHVFITLGTSWVYSHKEKRQYVANCHKIPQSEFQKELISSENIRESLKRMSVNIHQINPQAKVVFTVSPVRHLKDGFVENQQSKANLVVAVHQLIKENAEMGYFPSYELLLDELRDYRFYAADLLHPNQLAIDYIWEKFKTTWFDLNIEQDLKQIDSIQKGLLHKVFNPETEQYQKFLADLEKQKTAIRKKYSHITF